MSRWRPAHNKPLVSLLWNDAHGSATDVHTEMDIEHEPLRMTTYGILLREDAIGVTIANEWCGGKEWRGITFVPRALVVELRTLLPSPPRQPTAVSSPAADTASRADTPSH